MLNLRSTKYKKTSLNDEEGECTCKYCSDCACYLTTSFSHGHDHDPKSRKLNSKVNDTISIDSSRPVRDFINKELMIKSSKSKVSLNNITIASNLNTNSNNNQNEPPIAKKSSFGPFLQIPSFIKLISIKLFTNFIFTLVSVFVLAVAILKFDKVFFIFNNLDEFYNKLKKSKGRSIS